MQIQADQAKAQQKLAIMKQKLNKIYRNRTSQAYKQDLQAKVAKARIRITIEREKNALKLTTGD